MSSPGVTRPSFPEIYERELVPYLFRPWAEAMVERANVVRGTRLLDVACGTGIVARIAHERIGGEGSIVGVDGSPQMLAVAGAAEPRVDWRQGKAESLPVADGEQFDIVTCQQGLQFFADKLAALREMHRVLVPEGLLVLSTWLSVEENPPLIDLQRIAERHVGPIVDRRHALGDKAALEKILSESVFDDVRIETLSMPTRFPEASTFVRLNAMAIVGMSAAGPSLNEQQRSEAVAAIVKESASALGPFLDGSALVFNLRSHVALARR